MNTRQMIWITTCVVAIVLIALAFTPVVIPPGKYKPMFLGMPYTLWMGILLSIIMVGVTFLGTLVHPGREEEKKK